MRRRTASLLRRLAQRLAPIPATSPVTINISTSGDAIATGRAIEAALTGYRRNGGRTS